jgi:chromate transport protein ChrA
VIALLTSTIAGFVTGEARQTARRTMRAVLAYALAAVFATVGAGFLLAAGFMEVAEHIGPQHAALAIGGGFVVIAGIVIVIHMITRRLRVRSASKRRKDEMASVATAAAVSLVPLLLRGKGPAGLLMAPAALVAYAIYRENFRPKRTTREPDDQASGG